MKPTHFSEIPQRQLTSPSSGEHYSLARSLSNVFGLKDLAIHQEVLAPNQKASAPHYHTHKEELIYILQGQATILLHGERYLMNTGDCIGFPPSKRPHQLLNESDDEVVFLSIGTQSKEDTTVFTSSASIDTDDVKHEFPAKWEDKKERY